MADCLEWLRDQAIFLAQHGDAYDRVRREIEREEAAADLAPVSLDAVIAEANGSVVSLLDFVRPER
jgi:nucleotidyltransferase/DNA polymerase involved in DNA repair